MRRKPCPHCEKGELLVVKAEVVRNEQAQREEHTTTYVCEKCGKPGTSYQQMDGEGKLRERKVLCDDCAKNDGWFKRTFGWTNFARKM